MLEKIHIKNNWSNNYANIIKKRTYMNLFMSEIRADTQELETLVFNEYKISSKNCQTCPLS